MKTMMKIFLVISLVVLMVSCAAPRQELKTTYTDYLGTSNKVIAKREIKTEGNAFPDALERLHHGAVLGRVPGERTWVRVDVNNNNRSASTGRRWIDSEAGKIYQKRY